jgi:hypothetical protein
MEIPTGVQNCALPYESTAKVIFHDPFAEERQAPPKLGDKPQHSPSGSARRARVPKRPRWRQEAIDQVAMALQDLAASREARG